MINYQSRPKRRKWRSNAGKRLSCFRWMFVRALSRSSSVKVLPSVLSERLVASLTKPPDGRRNVRHGNYETDDGGGTFSDDLNVKKTNVNRYHELSRTSNWFWKISASSNGPNLTPGGTGLAHGPHFGHLCFRQVLASGALCPSTSTAPSVECFKAHFYSLASAGAAWSSVVFYSVLFI